MSRAEAGFTLPEVLVALAVGSAAVLVAGIGVSASIAARARTIAGNVVIEDLMAASGLQRRLLAQAVPVSSGPPQNAAAPTAPGASPAPPSATPAPAPSASATPVLAAAASPVASDTDKHFQGDQTHMHFVAALWGNPGATGLWELDLTIAPRNGRATLSISGHPYTADQEAARKAPTSLLSETLTGAGAKYAYASAGSDGGLTWSDAWSSSNGWPAAVSFDPDGEDGPAPPVVVSLAATVAPG